MGAGILCEKQINELIVSPSGTIRLQRLDGRPFKKLANGDAAIDITIGGPYWQMRGSCRTGGEYNVAYLISKHSTNPDTPMELSDDPVKLTKHNVYLFKAECSLDLTDMRIQGKATARSSIGRLDVLVRLLVDGSDSFDVVVGGKKHDLYVEVTPISFDLLVKKGMSLSQLRLFKGRERDISLTREELFHEEDSVFPVVLEDGRPYRTPCLDQSDEIWFPFRLNLEQDKAAGCSAFAAMKGRNLEPIDPDQRGANKTGVYDPHIYWEPIQAMDGAIFLEPDRLYILRSKERLRIPSHLALECKSYTTEMGEWRIEYAGFAHPYFVQFGKMV